MDVATARGGRIAAVLLTSPVPDHAAGSTSVALRVDVPVMAAAGAARVLGEPIRLLADRDLVDLADIPLLVHAAPGPGAGHLAFEVAALGAVLVGDLAGDGRQRGIPEPVDEAELVRSRGRIRDLGPRRWLPAHGPERMEG
jgi:glyoxylase-like metal-dependent hydrolase (beta-lactamase superfamily II)